MEGPWANIKAGCRGSHHPIHIANGGVSWGAWAPPISILIFFFWSTERTNAFFMMMAQTHLKPHIFKTQFHRVARRVHGGGGLTIWGLAHVSFYLHMRESPPESMLPASPFLACWGLCTNFFDLTHASFSCSVVSHIGPCQPPLLLTHFLLYEPGHVCSLND